MKPLQRFAIANLDLIHLGTLLPSTAVQLYPRNFTVATQQDPDSVLFFRSRPIDVIISNRCHLNTLQSCEAIAITSEY